MATNKDLLTEAIADAKAVKETAIANAKLALEEAFTPFLKDQLSAKLQEMDKEDKKETINTFLENALVLDKDFDEKEIKLKVLNEFSKNKEYLS